MEEEGNCKYYLAETTKTIKSSVDAAVGGV